MAYSVFRDHHSPASLAWAFGLQSLTPPASHCTTNEKTIRSWRFIPAQMAGAVLSPLFFVIALIGCIGYAIARNEAKKALFGRAALLNAVALPAYAFFVAISPLIGLGAAIREAKQKHWENALVWCAFPLTELARCTVRQLEPVIFDQN